MGNKRNKVRNKKSQRGGSRRKSDISIDSPLNLHDLSGVCFLPSSSSPVKKAVSNDTINLSPNKLILEHFGNDADLDQFELLQENTVEENESPDLPLGERNVLVNFENIFHNLRNVFRHEFECGEIRPLKIIGQGMATHIHLQCKMCKKVFRLYSHSEQQRSELNMSTVWGTIAIGQGYDQLEELLSYMGLHVMSKKTFSKLQTKFYETIDVTLADEIISNVAEEKRLAIENGDVDKDGIPFITVIGDGGWGIRSYNHSMKSPVGCAVVIGERTKQILYIGTRNKYCYICAVAEKKKIAIPQHTCHKNYEGTSTGMEKEMIVEAFCTSEELHGVRYLRYIGDGDSSVMANIAEKCPYGRRVIKVPCRNHSLRAYTSGLYGIACNTALGDARTRAKVRIAIPRLVKGVNCTIAKYSKGECAADPKRVQQIKEELKNGPSHVFGDHKKCGNWCEKKKDPDNAEENLVPILMQSKIWQELHRKLFHLLASAANLKPDTTTNLAECFMGMCSRMQGSKRVDRSKRLSYALRTKAAALKFCRGQKWSCLAWKIIYKKSPNIMLKRYASTRESRATQAKAAKTLQFQLHPEERNRKRSSTLSERRKTNYDRDYGPDADKPDLPDDLFADRQKEILDDLKREVATAELRNKLCSNTTEQYGCLEFRQAKEHRLTASNFGRIMKLQEHTNPQKTVESLLQPKDISGKEAIRYGQENESCVREKHAQHLGTAIENMGLCTNVKWPFLGASPDGAIGEDGILEVKSLYSARDRVIRSYVAEQQGVDDMGQPILDEEGKKRKKAKSFSSLCLELVDGKLQLKRNHSYYYQVQGQLGITERKFCDFVVATDDDIFYERLYLDYSTWSKMHVKLERFYMQCLLPEFADSRIKKGMPIRAPSYYLEGVAQKEQRGKKRKAIGAD